MKNKTSVQHQVNTSDFIDNGLSEAKSKIEVLEIFGNFLKKEGEKMFFFQKIKREIRNIIPTKKEKRRQNEKEKKFLKKYNLESLTRDIFKEKEFLNNEFREREILDLELIDIPQEMLTELSSIVVKKGFSSFLEAKEMRHFYIRLQREGVSRELAEDVIKEKYLSKSGKSGRTIYELLKGKIKDIAFLKEIESSEKLAKIARYKNIELGMDVIKGKITQEKAQEKLEEYIKESVVNNPQLRAYYSSLSEEYYAGKIERELRFSQKNISNPVSHKKISKIVELTRNAGLDLHGVSGIQSKNGGLIFEISPKKILDGIKTRIVIKVDKDGQFFVMNKLFDKDKRNKVFATKDELDKIINFSEYSAILHQVALRNSANPEELEKILKDENLERIIKAFKKHNFSPNQNPKVIFAKIIENIAKREKENLGKYLKNISKKEVPLEKLKEVFLGQTDELAKYSFLGEK